MKVALLLLLAFVAFAQGKAGIDATSDDDNLLPITGTSGSKQETFDFGSGDEEYDYEEGSGEDDYDDDDDDDDDEADLDEDEEEDLHFESDDVNDKNRDILYEYYNEIYEDDIEQEYETESAVPTTKTPSTTTKTEPTTVTSHNLLLMVASGLASFAIFTLAFVMCCYRRKGASDKSKTMPFVIDPAMFKSGGEFIKPQSSIVKSYQRVPTSTKEFLTASSPSGLENSSHILQDSGGSEKPLLP